MKEDNRREKGSALGHGNMLDESGCHDKGKEDNTGRKTNVWTATIMHAWVYDVTGTLHGVTSSKNNDSENSRT